LKKFLLAIIILLFFNISYSNIFFVNYGFGYTYNNKIKDDLFTGNFGCKYQVPFLRFSSLSLEYDFVMNGTIEIYTNIYYSSNIKLSYKNYFFSKYPSLKTSRTYFPYFSVSFSNLIDNHSVYSPGAMISIGIEFLIRKIGIIWDPMSIISYALTYISNVKQIFGISIYGKINYLKQNFIVETGIVISSGIVF